MSELKYDDLVQDLANALAREQGLLAELRHANDTIARLTAILEQTRESICSCNIVDVPEWFTVCEWHKGITNDSGHAEQLARMINRIGVEIDDLRDKNEALRHTIADLTDKIARHEIEQP